jgi:hypothetical protein
MTRPFAMLLTVILVAITAAAADVKGGTVHGQSHPNYVWKWYSNPRFQYAICYPGDLLVGQGESENGDGERFRGQGRAQLIVYGQNNALEERLKDVMGEAQSRLGGPSGKVTYKLLKSSEFVLSGQRGPTIFYAKTIYSHGQFKSFEMTYDRTWAAIYSPLLWRMISCFTDLAH